MDQATAYVQANSGWMGTLLLIAVLIGVLYAVYTYLYPGDDPTYTRLLSGEADARRPVATTGKIPAIYTGGDFTLSFWIYVDDWNYRASASKFLFALGPANPAPNTANVLTAVLTPLQNSLMVRAHTVAGGQAPPAPGSAPTAPSTTGPDITVESNLQALLRQQTSATMFQSTVEAPCDVKEVPIQRWVCITIVVSGRVLDIYMDGRLTRSCVLDNVVRVPTSTAHPLVLRLGESGGFGGRYSSVQMWNQQLTPDVIYGIYMMGPTQAQHSIFTDISKWLNLNVSFTGPAASGSTTSPPHQPTLLGAADSAYSTAAQDASSLYQRL
jgi:hypothetical protein